MTISTEPIAFGERSELLSKRLDYVFSLDVQYELDGGIVPGGQAPLRAKSPGRDEWNTFHVSDEEFIVTPDRIRRQVPRARIARGHDLLTISDLETTSLSAQLLFETDTPDPLSMHYTGVLSLRTGTVAVATAGKALSGKAFIASRQSISNPKYRWLVYNQLIGVGTVAIPPFLPARKRELHFSFDFYVGS